MSNKDIFLQNIKSESELRVEFGAIVHRQRLKKKLTQAKLADYCDVSSQLISKIEKGNSSVTLALFFKLIKILDIQFKEVFNYFFNIKSEIILNENQKVLIKTVVEYTDLTEEEANLLINLIEMLKKGK